MRTFGQVPLALWRDSRFVKLSDDARLALLYLWCGPHSTTAGIYDLQDGYASVDLGWKPERWEQARSDVEEANLITRDVETGTVFIHGYFAANRPANARHVAAILNQIASVTSTNLRQQALDAFEAASPKDPAPAAPTSHLDTGHLRRAGSGVR